MCKYKTLHHNEHGFIVRCTQCERIQIGFGSFSLTQTLAEFSEFKDMIYQNYISERVSDSSMPEQKNIQIPTPLRNMFWVFSLNELKNFTELLEHASLSLDIEKILCSNEN